MAVARRIKTGKRKRYQYRDNGGKITRVEIIKIRDMSALIMEQDKSIPRV